MLSKYVQGIVTAKFTPKENKFIYITYFFGINEIV